MALEKYWGRTAAAVTAQTLVCLDDVEVDTVWSRSLVSAMAVQECPYPILIPHLDCLNAEQDAGESTGA